ncbi:MAG: TldD/PmbA family protein [Candidatus Zixiibacteriota bacterium]
MNYRELTEDLIKKALNKGATQAEVYLDAGEEFNVQVRKGEIEILEQSQRKGLGLRVFVKNRLGFSHTSDFDSEPLNNLVDKTVYMAKQASLDEYNGLPEEDLPLASEDLQIYDSKLKSLDINKKIELARRCEEAAFAFDPRVKNSEGASFSHYETSIILANSLGKSISFNSSGVSLSCVPVAEEKGEKRGSVFWDAKRFFRDLLSPEEVGKIAAKRGIRLLGAKKVKSQKVPVIIESTAATRFLDAISSAINGESVFKKASFLADKKGGKIASNLVNVWDDGTMLKGLGSLPFDGEGIPTQRKKIIDQGVLTSFLYNTYTARKAKTKSTGNARRGYDSTPYISSMNFFLENGDKKPEDLIRGTSRGFYVTDLMGFGINTITGDFSQMAEGLWIENGELTYPVHEVTLAGTLSGLLQGIEGIANDLYFRSSTACPTIKISQLVLSGK